MRISDWSSDVCSSDLQAVGQLQQLLEQLLDVAAADVVALDQRLELLGKIGARAVQAYQPVQSGADRGLQRLQVGGLVLRCLEAPRQGFEVDLRQFHLRQVRVVIGRAHV